MELKHNDYQSPSVMIYEMVVEGCIATSGDIENSLSTNGEWDE